MKLRLKPLTAFSLVEVTLALGICSFCLISLVALMPSGLTATANATRRATAVQIASSLLADLQYIGPAEEVDSDGKPVLDQAGEKQIYFPTHTPLYNFPCGTGNFVAEDPADDTSNTYTSQFLTLGTNSELWSAVDSNGQYFVKTRISPEPSLSHSGPYQFTVEVSWPASAEGGPHKQGSVVLFGHSRSN